MPDEQKKDNEPVESAGMEAEAVNQDEVSPKIYLSHDGLFRVTFDNKNLAESFARENLPAEKYISIVP